MPPLATLVARFALVRRSQYESQRILSNCARWRQLNFAGPTSEATCSREGVLMPHTGRPETPLRFRFLAKIAFGNPGGDWLWTGARHPQGSGFIKRKDGIQIKASAFAESSTTPSKVKGLVAQIPLRTKLCRHSLCPSHNRRMLQAREHEIRPCCNSSSFE